jgi:phosphoglycolate phosphatase-like HAD superfamily hydrolase
LKDLKIFVDLDGTLKTEKVDGDSDQNDFGEKNPLSVTIEKDTWEFTPRPYVKEFLTEVRKHGECCLATLSTRRLAHAVVKEMGVEDYFTKFFTRENFQVSIPFFKKVIIVENDMEIGQFKLDKIANGLQPHQLQEIWKIDTYLGDPNDKTLLELIEELKKLG